MSQKSVFKGMFVSLPVAWTSQLAPNELLASRYTQVYWLLDSRCFTDGTLGDCVTKRSGKRKVHANICSLGPKQGVRATWQRIR
jgi:hypothetical protein